MPIDIITGELNKRITIEKKTIEIDDLQNQTEKWTEFHKCWSAVNGVSGREYWQAREQHEENAVNFKIRYCKKLDELNTTDFRVVFQDKIYDISSIDNVFFADNIVNLKALVRE